MNTTEVKNDKVKREYKVNGVKYNFFVGGYTINSYEWVWRAGFKWDSVLKEIVDAPVSDFNNKQKCEHCSKSIVHTFLITTPENKEMLIGKDCLEKITGIKINKSVVANPQKHLFKTIVDKFPTAKYTKKQSRRYSEYYLNNLFTQKEIKVILNYGVNSEKLQIDSDKKEISLTMLESKLDNPLALEGKPIYDLIRKAYNPYSSFLKPSCVQKGNSFISYNLGDLVVTVYHLNSGYQDFKIVISNVDFNINAEAQ